MAIAKDTERDSVKVNNMDITDKEILDAISEELEQAKAEGSKRKSDTREEKEENSSPQLSDVKGLGKKTLEILLENKIDSISKLMSTNLHDLVEMGISRSIVKKARMSVTENYEEYNDFTESLMLEDLSGVGGTTAKNLREKGLSLDLLATIPLRELERKYGVTPATALKYKEQIAELKGESSFITAYDMMVQKEKTPCFTFGINSLDELTAVPEVSRAGISLGETIEFFGAFRSGKSQISHQLCVTCQLPSELGGVNKKAIFIDTEGTFSPSRVKAMYDRLAEEKGWEKSFDDVMGDILYARAFNSDHQQLLVEKLLGILSKKPGEYGLLVIDSLLAHFRAEYAGRGTLAERQQTLNYHLSVLGRIADTYNLTVVITNQVQSNPAAFFGDPTQAAGGNIIGHWANIRFYLRKARGNKRIIRIFDSPSHAEKEAIFEIREEGLVDEE